jgi:ferredoxin--NADP+ reductase
MFKIVKREEMSDGTVVLNDIEAPKIARKAKPGQFVILKANETGERIPLTMAETDVEKGTVTVIYQVVGKSTALFRPILKKSAMWSVWAAAPELPFCTRLPGL